MADDNKQKLDSDRLQPGQHVGAYRIENLIGSGGMADVFYATHEGLQRPAAIKVLKASLAADETNLQRFMNEARAAAKLVHPNIVQVYDVGKDGDLRYIAQEFIAGVNLRQYLASRPSTDEDEVVDPTTGDRQLKLPECISILMQILAALVKSAASGIVHRDIKPENIILTNDGEIKVADFGLARTLLGDDPKLTRAGTTMGTPMYMSPEQIQDGEVDVRSDLYSLGVTLFHMLTGRPPFTGDTQLALAMKHVQAEPPPVAEFRDGLPESLQTLVMKLLAKDSNERFASPTAVLEFLNQNRTGDLATCWPNHAVSFATVTPAAQSPAIMNATMELQAKIRAKPASSRPRRGKKWFSRVGAAALILAGFAGGAAMTFSSPFVDEPVPEVFKGVPKQASAEAQFHFALVNESLKASPVDKWGAVEHFFPIRGEPANPVDQFYVILARIQQARALRFKGDTEQARQKLNATVDSENEIPKQFRALALIERAILEDELGEIEKVRDEVELALQLFRELKPDEQARLNDIVRAIAPESVKTPWFGDQGVVVLDEETES